MPKGLQRYYGRGHLHFLTFSCYRRLPLLKTVHARDAFVRELARVRAQYGFLLVGYVVMPEHVHLLISEPRRGTTSTVLQMLKQRVSRKMRKRKKRGREGQLTLGFDGDGEELRSFWQAILRFQRVQPGGSERETELYAREPGDSETGEASERLAVEQLVELHAR